MNITTDPQNNTKLALLLINDLHLVLPQKQILTLEPVEDLRTEDKLQQSVGWISTDAGTFPAYEFNQQLQLVSQQQTRRIVVVLNCELSAFAILVDELHMLQLEQFNWTDIPVAMKSVATPINQIAVFEEKLVCLTNTEDLYSTVIATSNTNEAA